MQQKGRAGDLCLLQLLRPLRMGGDEQLREADASRFHLGLRVRQIKLRSRREKHGMLASHCRTKKTKAELTQGDFQAHIPVQLF